MVLKLIVLLSLFTVAYCQVTDSNDEEKRCHDLTVGGIVLNHEVTGDYELIGGTTCCGKAVYRQTDTFRENYIFFYETTWERVDIQLVDPSKRNETAAKKTVDFLGRHPTKHDSQRPNKKHESHEHDDSNSHESQEDDDDMDQPDERNKRQTATSWKSSITGWRIGPVSCTPDSAHVMNMGQSSQPHDTAEVWMEFHYNRWHMNNDLQVLCADPSSNPSHHYGYEGRQMFGFILAICGASACLIHSLWKNYKKRRYVPSYPDNDPECAQQTPSARNHFVILTFPQTDRDPSQQRGPLVSAMGRDPDDEEDEEARENAGLAQGMIVEPPKYEEVPTIPEGEEPPPPSYEEAIRP